MTLNGKRTYVGFGFGAIQAGLFLYEAYCAHGFNQLVAAEVIPEVVDTMRRAAGIFRLILPMPTGLSRRSLGR